MVQNRVSPHFSSRSLDFTHPLRLPEQRDIFSFHTEKQKEKQDFYHLSDLLVLWGYRWGWGPAMEAPERSGLP